MAIDMQTLDDAIIALLVSVGIAVALSLALIAAAAIHLRGTKRAGRTAALATHREQADDKREFALR